MKRTMRCAYVLFFHSILLIGTFVHPGALSITLQLNPQADTVLCSIELNKTQAIKEARGFI